MGWDPPDDTVDLGHGWSVMFQVEVPCRKVDPEDWDTCPIVGHGPGHFDTSLEPGRTLTSRGHTLEQLDPLHVEASILCKAIAADGQSCDGHGWIRDGRWVPA